MRKPKPGFRMYLKTRFKRPLKLPLPLSYDFIYANKVGDRFKERFSVHTAIINLTAVGLSFVTLIRLNCTIWYFLSWVFVFFILRYLRYLWTDFSMLDENNKPAEKTKPMSVWQKVLLALEVILMIVIVTGVTILSNASPYARATNYLNQPTIDREIEIGETYLHPIDQETDSLLIAYEASAAFAQTAAQNAVITDYGAAVLPEGTVYFFIFKNESPSAFLKLTDEYEICWISTYLDHKGFLSFSYMQYDSAFADFDPIDPPTAEIDTQRIIDMLCANTSLSPEDAESVYISTGFFPDLPKLSDAGGSTWAVRVNTVDTCYYYTVNLDESTAVLEKTEPIVEEE